MKKNKFCKKMSVLAVILCFVLSLVPSVVADGVVSSKTYTLDADFDEGTLVGLEHDTVHDQLQLSTDSATLPFIWVPNSNEGTVSKYDTETGKELARYRTGPTTGGNPSRTTVDQEGNVWFGNRNTGTMVKIGLFENGQCVDADGDGVIETSSDLNDDGVVNTAEMRAWGDDECVLHEVYVGGGPRGVAIDSSNNLWAGTYNLAGGNKFFHIDGETGAILDTINNPYRSYGAVVDANGNLWSSTISTYVLKVDTTTKTITRVNLNHVSYGLGIDADGHLFVAGWGTDRMSKIDVNTNAVIKYAPQGDTNTRGLAVTSDGDVWAANSKDGDVTRLDNDLNIKATIDVGAGNWGVMSTGVAVDAAGKVWVCNYYDGRLHRIDPATNTVDLVIQTPGMGGTGVGMHYSYSDMTGIIARSITAKVGTWTVVFDSEAADTSWGTVSWNSLEPEGSSVVVNVRSSNDGATWSAWETVGNDVDMSATPDGRYLQIETTIRMGDADASPVLYDLSVRIGNNAPVANAGADVVHECDGSLVTLDGSESFDPDGDALTYVWTWDSGSAEGVNPEVELPLGTTTVTLTVSDGILEASDTVDILVEDTTAPELSLAMSPDLLWPPNHRMVDILADLVAVDACDSESLTFALVSVVSNEPEDGRGDGRTSPDIEGVDCPVEGEEVCVDYEFSLRSERSGAGSGRIYSITYLVTDVSGNSAEVVGEVVVPHDMGDSEDEESEEEPAGEDNGKGKAKGKAKGKNK